MPGGSISVEQALSQPVEEMVPEVNGSTSSSSSTSVNGTHHGGSSEAASTVTDASTEDGEDDDRSKSREELLDELQRTREDRDGFEGQYKGLLAKLTQMRTTLGQRLRQDAEELDRREGQIETLTTQVEELQSTVSTIQSELISSHTENERVTRELDALRVSSAAAIQEATKVADAALATASQRSSSESATTNEEKSQLEGQARQLSQTLEIVQSELSTRDAAYQEEKARRTELETALQQARLDREGFEAEISRLHEVLEREKESSRNIQMVLEEFQAEQDAELQRSLGDYQRKWDATASQLEECKEKLRFAEKRYLESKDAAERAKSLEQEVKEKNLLIGKLRHEAVILNEHLTEALRRLNRESTSENVDRRLVTNVLLQFLTTPRQDAKRFQMLTVLASILQWDDEEKEQAGIQKSTGGGFPSIGRTSRGHRRTSGAGGAQAAVTGQEESFSNLFVEFLLSEAGQAQPNSTSSTPAPTSPAATSPVSTPGRVTSPSTAPSSRTNFDLGQLGSLGAGGRKA